MTSRRGFMAVLSAFFVSLFYTPVEANGNSKLRLWVGMKKHIRALGYRGKWVPARNVVIRLNGIEGVEKIAFVMDTYEGWVDCLHPTKFKNEEARKLFKMLGKGELRKRTKSGWPVARYYGRIETTPSIPELIEQLGDYAYRNIPPSSRTIPCHEMIVVDDPRPDKEAEKKLDDFQKWLDHYPDTWSDQPILLASRTHDKDLSIQLELPTGSFQH